MPQIFPKAANVLAKTSIVGGLGLAAAAAWASYEVYQAPYYTRAGQVVTQPVPFSHQHHVQGLGLDCRYCHTGVERSAYAGMPSTETCMTCHSQLYTDAPALQPVRDSWSSGVPIAWNRVNKLPEYVYFNHSIHLAKGVGCATCHGRMDQEPLAVKAHPYTMGWCLECHRAPEQHLRPLDQVYAMDWTPAEDPLALGARLKAAYHIPGRRLTNCSTCHW
jgi:hypothetical protein